MELSFWERQTFFHESDVLVVGSGIVGLNTARAIREKYPNRKIMVIDRGILPYGASTRNAGFACFGSVGELLADLQIMSADQVFSLVERRYRGLCRLREIVGDAALNYEPLGGYELFTPAEENHFRECLDHLPQFNRELKRITGSEVYSRTDAQTLNFGFKGVQHILFNAAEGQLDTGKMMEALLAHVRAKEIKVYNGISIRNWQENTDGVVVETGEGFSLRTQQLVICTNGFATPIPPIRTAQ